jgi:eukaryotic-like serine/threonine-protein kinase
MAADVFGIVGRVIDGTYQVKAVVAEGGFAVVYRAHHTKFRADVALKCLKIPQQLDELNRREFLEQFRAEAELLFQLSASLPTVVRPLHVDAFTAGRDTLVPFMALEWLEGETLDAIITRRRQSGLSPLTLRELVTLLTPVARALERAHAFAGPDGPISVVHRDLKPENIFVAKLLGEQVVKILDFGIGKAKSVASQVAGRASQTATGLASFTPAYGAPEQWLPKRYGQTGPWTDVWGLALTLVEALAARPVIEGEPTAMMGTAIDERRRPTPQSEGVRVSDPVEAVFRCALAVDPRDRYPEAGSFWNALLAALGVANDPEPLVPSAACMPALPAIPDLQLATPARSVRPTARVAQAPSHGEIELDDSIGVELALDLPAGERIAAGRTSSAPIRVAEPVLPVNPSPPPQPAAEASGAPLRSADAVASFVGGPRPVVNSPSPQNHEANWMSRAAPGLTLLGLSIVVTLADQAYAASAGEVFSLGPLRGSWLAVLFLLSGLGWLTYEFGLKRR